MINAMYTWKDVEVKLKENSKYWPKEWKNIDVYSDELIIYTDSIEEKTDSYKYLKECLGAHFSVEKNAINLDISTQSLSVHFEQFTENFSDSLQNYIPLFQNSYFREKNLFKEDMSDNLPGAPIIAFHSYKGGVGRTLSLLSLVRELSSRHSEEKEYKVLIIDSDIEAPGLTWLAKDENLNMEISYMDILSILHSSGYTDQTTKSIAQIVEKSVIQIETDQKISTQYFIPAYRLESQVMDIYAHPQKIVSTNGKEYIITEFLSSLGSMMGVDAVLMDLRAGISEFSAPVLFDPRVKKIFVSSTSTQSIRGTQTILKQIFKEPIKDKFPIPTILLTMIPDRFDINIKERIVTEITQELIFEEEQGDSFLSDIVLEVPFSNNLIHLEGFAQINEKLAGTETAKVAKELADNLFEENISSPNITVSGREKFITDIHTLTEKEMVAEGSDISKILSTKSLDNLVRRYRLDNPVAIMLGAKGSGKTFIYKQLLKSKKWSNFVNAINNEEISNETKDTFVVPVLASTNRKKFISLLHECIQNSNDSLKDVNINKNSFSTNEQEINKAKLTLNNEIEWREQWKKIILSSLGNSTLTLEQIDETLEKTNQRVLLIIDGLEDLFNNTISDNSSKFAIKALCQGAINDLNELEHNNIGMLIFLRKDIAENSIVGNFAQFSSQYSDIELKWSHTEALRLALWLANQVNPSWFKTSIPIEKASYELIETSLYKLWGTKLGKSNSKEAFSSRWILAALSDFNGQLQARDIIRFLKWATVATGLSTYQDRIIMPPEIRNALGPCSGEKFDEIKKEIVELGPIFKKFETTTSKLLPFNPDDIDLTPEDKTILTQQGYLKIYAEQYYLPEIIRHALGFKYQGGARPKVLSLLFAK